MPQLTRVFGARVFGADPVFAPKDCADDLRPMVVVFSEYWDGGDRVGVVCLTGAVNRRRSYRVRRPFVNGLRDGYARTARARARAVRLVLQGLEDWVVQDFEAQLQPVLGLYDWEDWED